MVKKKNNHKKVKRNHGLVAYGIGAYSLDRLGYLEALERLEQGDFKGALHYIAMYSGYTSNIMDVGKKAIGLQIIRQNIGSVKLFSTKKAVVSMFGR